MIKGEIILKAPFIIQKFKNIEVFIFTVFPNLQAYLHEQISDGIHEPELESKVYTELEKQFKLFIVRNYSRDLEKYINKEAKHANKEAMREVILSTISITLNVNDAFDYKLNKIDILYLIRTLIKRSQYRNKIK